MRFIAAKCPNCGAKIKVDVNKKIYHCDYCRSDIILDDGRGLNPEVPENHKLHIDELLAQHKKFSKFIFIPIIIGFVLVFSFFIFTFFNIFSFFGDSQVGSSSYNFLIDDVGVMSSFEVKILLNNVVDNISEYDKEIVIVYDNEEYDNTTEIMTLTVSVSDLRDNFMVTNEKDSDGYINKIIIVTAN